MCPIRMAGGRRDKAPMHIPMRLLLPIFAAVLLTAVAAISYVRGAETAVGNLVVTSAWARATPPGANVGAAYVTVENRGAEDDTLVSAESPVAQSVMAHETAEENGVATMRPLAEPAIPAGGTLAMEPGGIHLMLMGLTAPLKKGESVPLTLTFAKAGAAHGPARGRADRRRGARRRPRPFDVSRKSTYIAWHAHRSLGTLDGRRRGALRPRRRRRERIRAEGRELAPGCERVERCARHAARRRLHAGRPARRSRSPRRSSATCPPPCSSASRIAPTSARRR